MARPIWTGAITFGLVSVPVAMYTATSEHEVSFHQFEKDTSDRIRYKRVNERTGREVDYDDIVKGADVGDGNYVMLDAEELESVAPGRSRSLEISRFVDLDEIDPIYYQRTYYLGPGSEETTKVYGLLRDAMAGENRAAIGTLVMRGKEYLTAIRAEHDLLILQTMYFADEVRDPKDEIDSLPERGRAGKAELAMAHQLIDSMSGAWKPSEYHDTYTERVQELIEAKKKGREVTPAEPAPEPTGVSDLLEVLRRSVDEAAKRRGTAGSGSPASGSPAKKTASGGRSGKTASRKAPTKRTAAKKTTAAKSGPAKATATKATTGKTAAEKKAPAKAPAAKATPAKATTGKATTGKATAGKGASGKGASGKGTEKKSAAKKAAPAKAAAKRAAGSTAAKPAARKAAKKAA